MEKTLFLERRLVRANGDDFLNFEYVCVVSRDELEDCLELSLVVLITLQNFLYFRILFRCCSFLESKFIRNK